ncbi:MAG: phosphoenolpyruvate hydrolase family protein [Proteobacteria bacterium]|nr:phosphoenolpyruvate hydrolase family protein [Pseudomonadota bacterium]
MQVEFVQLVPKVIAAAEPSLTIVCPWLRGLPAESGLWISALPIHDVNSFIDGDLGVDPAAGEHRRLYFGVFALDRFRSQARIFSMLRAQGIERIINLPSVSFFDGRSASTLQSLDLGWSQEVEFLRAAKAAGFNVALCARRPLDIGVDNMEQFDFILGHEGPRSRFTIEPRPI